jgi:hypothetical protein
MLQQQTLACGSPENSLVRVGELECAVPAAGHAPYRITFELADSTGVLSTNEYEVQVAAAEAAT